MKFSDINLGRKGCEETFLRILKREVHPDFQMGKKEVSVPTFGKQTVSTTVPYRIVLGGRSIDLDLVLHRQQVNHLWLSRSDTQTFYALEKGSKIDMIKMNELAPLLRAYIVRGFIDQNVFGKCVPRTGDDWPEDTAFMKAVVQSASVAA